MNKVTYLKELSEGLRKLPPSEREDALQYYTEYFQDTAESEEQAIQALGTPNRVANSILAESNVNKMDDIKSPTKKGASALGTILLLIFAAPIALPIAILLAVTIILLAISVFAVIFSLVISGIGFVISGLVFIVNGVAVFFVHAPTAVLTIGIGIAALGGGVLLGVSAFIVGRKLMSGFVGFVKKQVGRRASK